MELAYLIRYARAAELIGGSDAVREVTRVNRELNAGYTRRVDTGVEFASWLADNYPELYTPGAAEENRRILADWRQLKNAIQADGPYVSPFQDRDVQTEPTGTAEAGASEDVSDAKMEAFTAIDSEP